MLIGLAGVASPPAELKSCGHCALRAFAAAILPISSRFATRDLIDVPGYDEDLEEVLLLARAEPKMANVEKLGVSHVMVFAEVSRVQSLRAAQEPSW
jgi:hypothetical protein